MIIQSTVVGELRYIERIEMKQLEVYLHVSATLVVEGVAKHTFHGQSLCLLAWFPASLGFVSTDHHGRISVVSPGRTCGFSLPFPWWTLAAVVAVLAEVKLDQQKRFLVIRAFG